jgi:hypothetical protein
MCRDLNEREPRKLGGWEGKVWLADDMDAVDEEIAALFYADDEDD